MVHLLSFGKASGYDGIDTEHITFGGPMMVTIITNIFNKAITTTIFPEVFLIWFINSNTQARKKRLH